MALIDADRFRNRPTSRLRFTNNSGGSLSKGDVVIVDSTGTGNDLKVTVTTTYGSDKRIGVCLGNAIAGADVDVAFGGVVLVNLKSGVTVAPGDRIVTSTSAGKADVSSPDGYGASDPSVGSIIGTALQEDNSGVVLVVLHLS